MRFSTVEWLLDSIDYSLKLWLAANTKNPKQTIQNLKPAFEPAKKKDPDDKSVAQPIEFMHALADLYSKEKTEGGEEENEA